MTNHTITVDHPHVQTAIDLLKDVDGETMQYIIRQLQQEDQMLTQLMMTLPINDIRQQYGVRLDYEYGCDICPE